MARRGPPHAPRRPSKEASERYSNKYTYVSGSLERRLSEYGAWPVSPFKLEVERAGIYQDVTGACLNQLEREGEIAIQSFDGHNYIVSPGSESAPNPEVKAATNQLYEFFDEQSNAYFAELISYVAICKIYDELSIEMDVHPKGSYPWKFDGWARELDAFIEFFQERFPVEVYNGLQFVGERHRKLNTMEGLASDENPNSNPILINRLSSPFAKKASPDDGLIIDTRTIAACEETNPDLKMALDVLNIDSHFELLPQMRTEDGLMIDGSRYDDRAGDHARYAEIRPSKMVTAASELPDQYLQRIRGGLQFLYVSTLFRRTSEPVDQIAATVIQDIYHHLLRHPDGTSDEDAIDIGWESYRSRHTRVKMAVERFEPDIRERARELLSRLISDDIVYRGNGKLYARKSIHPHVSLDFNP